MTSFQRLTLKVLLICLLLIVVSDIVAQRYFYRRETQNIEEVQGRIVQWQTNDDFVYHGFIFQANSNDKFFVRFPLELGKQIRDLGDDDLQIRGFFKTTKAGTTFFQLTAASSGKKQLQESKENRRPHPPSRNEIAIRGKGKIEEILYNDKNRPIAYLLTNGAMLKMPPHIFWQIGNVALVGTPISYEGLERQLNNGEVQEKNVVIVHARQIEINGTRYFIK